METEIVAAIIAATGIVVGAALGATAGGLFTWLAQRDKKARERDSKRIAMLVEEVRARIGLEEAAIDWIVGLKNTGEMGAGVQRKLRDQAKETTGFRPKMSENKLYR